MANGIRIRNRDGSVILDTSTGVSFILGSVTTSSKVNGSLTIPDVGLKQYFAYVTGTSSTSTNDEFGALLPQVEVEGRTVKWVYGNDTGKTPTPSITITYGGSSN